MPIARRKASVVAACVAGIWGAAPAAAQDNGKFGLTKAEQELAFERGRISGQAEACGLDWKSLNFEPMMAYWRRIGKDSKQTALLATLHGAGQGFPERVACSPKYMQELKSKLKFER